jgi:hypothetical protein
MLFKKRLSTILLFLFFTINNYAQEVAQVTFSGGTTLSGISFVVDQDLLIRISDDGKIIGWGREILSLQSNQYARNLQPYLGRVEYYGKESDSAMVGKVKSIGTCNFTYYRSSDEATNVGKLRTVGKFLLDYYSNFENEAIQGKLRFIGGFILEYYPSYEDEGYRGKLKTFGSNAIRYHSSFDDKFIRGKVKSIGTVNFQWNTSMDRFGGGLRSGHYRQNISGIIFILQ